MRNNNTQTTAAIIVKQNIADCDINITNDKFVFTVDCANGNCTPIGYIINTNIMKPDTRPP